MGDYVVSLLTFSLIGLGIHLWAHSKGYLSLSKRNHPEEMLSGKALIVAFVLYIGIPFAIPSLIDTFILDSGMALVVRLTLFEMLYIATTMALLTILFFSRWGIKGSAIWKEPHHASILSDIGAGIATYAIAMPFVIAGGQLAEIVSRLLLSGGGGEQTAVRYLKLVRNNPALLTIALIVIMICAPILEECLFRGLLLTWLRKQIGVKAAILISALLFALFHFSPSQGVGNIPLITSLTLFALYLGFIYEKRRSLFSPIALHMTFNSISIFRILWE